MIDLDEALAREGAAWRATLAGPPDLAGAAARVTTPPRHRRAGVAASVAAIAAVAVVALVLLLRGPDRPGGVPPAVRVGGQTIPYAGTLSFRDAVLDPDNPQLLHVFVDKDELGAGQGVCSSERERGIVTSQTADQVHVLVAGYARPAGSECPGDAHGLSPVAVRLARPLGSRALIDSTDGTSHPVLGPATVPRLHRLPTGCPPDSWVTWNEHTGEERRAYQSAGCDVAIDAGRPGLVGGLDHSPGATRAVVVVSGHRATLVRTKEGGYFYSAVEWRSSPDRVVRLVMNQLYRARSSRSEFLAFADSIR